MALHKDLSWISNYTNYFPTQPWLSTFNYLFKIPILSKIIRDRKRPFPLIIPSEGYNFWDLVHPIKKPIDPPLFERDVKEANIGLMKKVIMKHLKYSNSSRFLNKNKEYAKKSILI